MELACWTRCQLRLTPNAGDAHEESQALDDISEELQDLITSQHHYTPIFLPLSLAFPLYMARSAHLKRLDTFRFRELAKGLRVRKVAG